MFRASTDGGQTFGDKINLSNTTNSDSSNVEDSADSFLDRWSKFKDTIRWYVEQTHTIVARRR
jgi:hypothetical protein